MPCLGCAGAATACDLTYMYVLKCAVHMYVLVVLLLGFIGCLCDVCGTRQICMECLFVLVKFGLELHLALFWISSLLHVIMFGDHNLFYYYVHM